MDTANYINHVVLVLDESASMRQLASQVVTVADNQIKYLSQRSKDLDQETRATVYTFNTSVRCVYYDKDVLRMPSIAGAYRPNGQTALIDATLKAISDLEQTATLYGDHAFLIYVLTDGQENASGRMTARKTRAELIRGLATKINALPDNWTLAAMVPDQNGVFEAKSYGFPPNNVSVWSTTERGIVEVGEVIQRTTENFMQARAVGIRGSRSLFSLDVSNLTPSTVAATLMKLPPKDYVIFPVTHDAAIAEYVTQRIGFYTLGHSFYELTKRETIQAQKQICVRDNDTGDVYAGRSARQLLGLPDYEIRISPADRPKYDVFVQSTSMNRKLIAGTEVLVLK